ncbi:MAG: hypothetical protein ACREPT_07460 [Rudaea sp.]
MSLRAHIAGLLLVVASTPSSAAPLAYGESIANVNSQSQGTLYRIDLATRVASLIGPAGLVGGAYTYNVRGLSFAPGGQLYAVSEDLAVLLQINATTGKATLIGALNTPSNATQDLSMAFTCDGKAWLASGTTGNFWQVNTSTGATTLVGNLGGTITGLTAQGNTLYGTGSQANQNLYTIDTTNAKTTLVGPYGGTTGAVHTISPGFDGSGQLWAILDNNPGYMTNTIETWSNLAQIDPAGAMTKLGTITGANLVSGVGLIGLAIAPPVCGSGGGDPGGGPHPTPALSRAGLLLLLLSLIALAGAGMRMRRRS